METRVGPKATPPGWQLLCLFLSEWANFFSSISPFGSLGGGGGWGLLSLEKKSMPCCLAAKEIFRGNCR